MSVVSLPGTFAAPDTVLARVHTESGEMTGIDRGSIAKAFLIGDARVFDDDPRFGLIVLSEIASRALSPAVNDPGTAVDVIGTLVRPFALWSEPVAPVEHRAAALPAYDHVEVPELSFRDMFDDAFTGIARDGAATVEVAGRLQKAFASGRHVGRRVGRALAASCTVGAGQGGTRPYPTRGQGGDPAIGRSRRSEVMRRGL